PRGARTGGVNGIAAGAWSRLCEAAVPVIVRRFVPRRFVKSMTFAGSLNGRGGCLAMKLLSALMSIAVGTTALGGVAQAENPSVNVQIFRPSAHVGDLLSTMTSVVGEHTQWGAGLFLHFGKNALVFVDTSDEGDALHEVVQDQLTADLYGSIALRER